MKRLFNRYFSHVEIMDWKATILWLFQDISGYTLICRFAKRAPIVWRYLKLGFYTQDYEYSFAVDEFLNKLEYLAKHIEKHNIIENANEIAGEIRTFCKLMSDVIYERQDILYDHILNEKYGEIELVNTSIDPKTGFSEYKCKRKKETDENSLQIRKEQRLYYKLAEKQREKDLKDALELFRTKFRGWWC